MRVKNRSENRDYMHCTLEVNNKHVTSTKKFVDDRVRQYALISILIGFLFDEEQSRSSGSFH